VSEFQNAPNPDPSETPGSLPLPNASVELTDVLRVDRLFVSPNMTLGALNVPCPGDRVHNEALVIPDFRHFPDRMDKLGVVSKTSPSLDRVVKEVTDRETEHRFGRLGSSLLPPPFGPESDYRPVPSNEYPGGLIPEPEGEPVSSWSRRRSQA